MDFLKSIAIAASGLRAQAGRMRVIAENIANADSTAQRPAAIRTGARSRPSDREMDRALDAQHRRDGPREAPTRQNFASNTSRAIRPPMPTAMSNIPTSIRWSR